MPKLYKYLGFILYFYSDEHLPVHIHIKKTDREIKAEFHYTKKGLEIIFKETNKSPLSESEITQIQPFLKKYHLQIVQKWQQYFIFNKKLKIEEITTKI